MRMSEIRHYSELEKHMTDLQNQISSLDDRMSRSTYGGIRTIFEKKIAELERLLEGVIGNMLTIDSLIIGMPDPVDRDILEMYKCGESIEYIAECIGYSSRTVSRHLRRIQEAIADI